MLIRAANCAAPIQSTQKVDRPDGARRELGVEVTRHDAPRAHACNAAVRVSIEQQMSNASASRLLWNLKPMNRPAVSDVPGAQA